MSLFRESLSQISPTCFQGKVGQPNGDQDCGWRPLDVLVIVEEPTFPGCRAEIRAIGVLAMGDEKGINEKILAVPDAEPRFEGIDHLIYA